MFFLELLSFLLLLSINMFTSLFLYLCSFKNRKQQENSEQISFFFYYSNIYSENFTRFNLIMFIVTLWNPVWNAFQFLFMKKIFVLERRCIPFAHLIFSSFFYIYILIFRRNFSFECGDFRFAVLRHFLSCLFICYN